MILKRQMLRIVVVGLLLVGCGGQVQEVTPTATRMSELDRVAGLLDGYELEERPLSFPVEAIQAKAGLHLVTADEQVDIMLFEFESSGDITTVVSKLAAEGIDLAAEAQLSFTGTNGIVLFVVRNIAPTPHQEDARWLVSEISGVLAGEE
jgi:hypothetical protein